MMKEGAQTVEMQDVKAETHMKENQSKRRSIHITAAAATVGKEVKIARTSNMSEGCCLWDNENQ